MHALLVHVAERHRRAGRVLGGVAKATAPAAIRTAKIKSLMTFHGDSPIGMATLTAELPTRAS
jgi:hypothetical protein